MDFRAVPADKRNSAREQTKPRKGQRKLSHSAADGNEKPQLGECKGKANGNEEKRDAPQLAANRMQRKVVGEMRQKLETS